MVPDGFDPCGTIGADAAATHPEHLAPHLGNVVLGVEGQRGLAALGLHRGHAPEVRVGQQAGAQRFERGVQCGRVDDVELADDEGLGAALLPDQDAALGVEQRGVACLVDEEVQRAGRIGRGHAEGVVWKAPGRPPCSSITRSILAIRRMVSDSATTTFW